jgi:hypothetical protein
MADGNQITADEWESWITPKVALKLVSDAMHHDWSIAASAIIRRLNAGLVLAHVKTGEFEQAGRVKKLKDYVAVPVSVAQTWGRMDRVADLPFWTSGDADVHHRVTTGYGHDAVVSWRLFGIRFDPAGINDLAPGSFAPVASPAPPPSTSPLPVSSELLAGIPKAPETSTPPPAPQPHTGKPLAPAALQAWHEAYKLAYQPHERNLDHAWTHAKWAFPEKSVTRESIRKLMGGGKRGPRAKS